MGTRPRLPADQRYQNAYPFGAVCPKRGAGAALTLQWANIEAMQLHLDEISKYVARNGEIFYSLKRPRSSSKNGENTTTPSGRTVLWDTVRRHQKQSSQ